MDKASNEKDINDIFEELLFAEEHLIEKGYAEGFESGKATDNIDAYHLGYHRGAELGAELGYYLGVVNSYSEHFKTYSATEKINNTLATLTKLIEGFPRHNSEDVDILARADDIRVKYKLLCSLLKVDAAFPELQSAIRHVERILAFLEETLPLANCHMVDYFTKSNFSKYISHEIRLELENVGCSRAVNLILEGDYSQTPKLKQFFDKANALTLQNNPQNCNTLNECHLKLRNLGASDLNGLKLEIFMTPKKSHEVEILSAVASACRHVSKNTHIVDIGDGKGYLSSMLALHHKIPVLGVDASNINTNGALKRVEKLQRVWKGVVDKPKKSYPAKNDNTSSSDGHFYKRVTQFVDEQTDFKKLLKDAFANSENKINHIGIVGLHTCGNLASNSLKIYASNADVASICNVSCCYHLLNEKFEEPTGPGFPLSIFLTDKKYTIGNRARMVAAQSVDRVLDKKELPNVLIYYRALLQVILEKHCTLLPISKVGKIKKELKCFVDYFRIAARKLKLDFELSDSELMAFDNDFSSRKEELNLFYLIRNRLAPVIESLILLDRLIFLLEHGFENSFLVQLFDPVKSPRCYGIISIKKL